MGVKAVESHAKATAHKKAKAAAESTTSVSSLFATPVSCGASVENGASTSTQSSGTGKSMSVTDVSQASAEATKAAVIWTLRTVCNHQSFSSNDDIGEILQMMFPSCDALKVFSCGQDKTAYTAKHGLAPFFKDSLKKNFLTRVPYSLLFDESMNKVTKNKQLDVHVMYWDGDQVKTRYYGSAFLGHSRSDDLLSKFKVLLSN